MQIKAEFVNGDCFVVLTPSDEWEQKLLGAVAKGGEEMGGKVTYMTYGHFSCQNAKVVKITLKAKGGE